MTCHEVRERAPLYLSGEMSAAERDVFTAHLAGCADCEQELDAQAHVDARIARALSSEAPDISRIEAHVRQEMAGTSSKRWWLAAAGVIVALAAAYGLMRRPVSTPAPMWFAEAARDHRVEVVEGQARRWRVEPAEMKKVAEQSGLSLGQAQGLAAAGYTLERAKICGLDKQRMLHLVFSDGTRRYSVYVGPHAGAKADVRQTRSGSEEVAGFETGRMRVAVVTAGGAAECEGLARMAAARL